MFSPIKRRGRILDGGDENYDWKEIEAYNTEQAFEVLDNDKVDDAMKQEHMALLKNFKKKLEGANIHFEQAFSQESQHLQTIIKVLDL